MPVNIDTAAIRDLRADAVALDEDLANVETNLVLTQQQIEAIERAGRDPKSAATRYAELTAERERLVERRSTVEGRISRLRDVVDPGVPHEDAVATLGGQTPVLMLPVRIETRFDPEATILRIRVFPDDIHVHSHEPQLTVSEQEAGRSYWRARTEAADDDALVAAAWRTLAAGHGPHRGSWIVKTMTPRNPDANDPGDLDFPAVPTRAAPWTRPPFVTAMPDRWVALGYRGDTEVFRKWGNPVPDRLEFGPSPDPLADDTVPDVDTLVDESLPVDEGMRWLIDFSEAERIGMGITVTAADLQIGRAHV